MENQYHDEFFNQEFYVQTIIEFINKIKLPQLTR